MNIPACRRGGTADASHLMPATNQDEPSRSRPPQLHELRLLIDRVASFYGFTAAHGGWVRKLPVGLLVLVLRRSNLSRCYDMKIKLFLGRNAPEDAAEFRMLVKFLSGDIFRGHPQELRGVFDMGSPLSLAERRAGIDSLFDVFIAPILSDSRDAYGLLRLRNKGVFSLLPAIEARLKPG